MYKIELLKGNWYHRSYGKDSFNEIVTLEHLRDLEFIGDNVVIIPGNHILIGKAITNQIIIDEIYVQRRHSRIEILPKQIILRNLGARDPTLVLRGNKVHRASNQGIEIYEGDVLRFQETELRLLEARVS